MMRHKPVKMKRRVIHKYTDKSSRINRRLAAGKVGKAGKAGKAIRPGSRKKKRKQGGLEQAIPPYVRGFEEGYSKGIKEAPSVKDEAAVSKAFQDGVYTGGDGLIDTLLPGDMILPEVPVIEVIQAGLDQMRHRFLRLMYSGEMSGEIIGAMDAKTPMSIVRLGDGELLTLAQEVLMTPEQILKEGKFLGYAGVQVPDLEVRDQLLHAIRHATIIGIPKLRVPNFQPLALAVFRAYGIDYRTLRLTDSLINYQIYKDGFLPGILAGRRVLTVGNLAEPLASFLSMNGVAVTGHVSPVRGVKDVPAVMEQIRQAGDFDIALISAGISAVLLAQQVASELGKVALDFGHLADSMLKGEAPYHI